MPLAMLQAFDEPLMTPNCERRASSTVSPQALFMMNSPFVEEQAEAMAKRILKDARGGRSEPCFREAWRLAFGVNPNECDSREGIAFLDRQAQILQSERQNNFRSNGRGSKPSALAHLCQALLDSNGFLYVD